MKVDPDELLRMYNDGQTQEEIALELGYTQSAIAYHLRKHPDYVPRKGRGKKENVKHGLANQGKRGSRVTAGTFRPGARQAHRRRGW